MEKDSLKNVVYLVLFLLGALLLLYYLPALRIAGHTLRAVDVLSDVRKQALSSEAVEEESIDSLLVLPVPKPAFVDTCRTGVTCIEDFSDSTRRGMTAYYEALDELSDRPRPVRIAYFGDSFIEADILTADLRELLQQQYGGRGVGFVPVTSATNGFRPTVRHSFGGWQSHATTDSLHFDRSKQGISGHYFIPVSGAYMELRGQRKYGTRLDTCRQASIFFYTRDSVMLTAIVNQSETYTGRFASSSHLQQMNVEGRIGSVRWTVQQADSAIFYGAAMDDEQGISVDNFALRASSGLSLRYIPEKTLCDFNRLRPYDLIVLQYGLNVATERGRVYDKYYEGMRTTVQYFKRCFPQTGILIVGVGDRDYRDEKGELRTMPGIKNLIRYQRQLAAEEGVAFWNLFEAMGGEGSMIKLVEAEPPMANLDYTHINFRGGKHLAKILCDALVYGKEQYDRRRAYEEE